MRPGIEGKNPSRRQELERSVSLRVYIRTPERSTDEMGDPVEHQDKERLNTAEDARGSGDDQAEGDGEEGIKHLQPDGTVAVDIIRNEHEH